MTFSTACWNFSSRVKARGYFFQRRPAINETEVQDAVDGAQKLDNKVLAYSANGSMKWEAATTRPFINDALREHIRRDGIEAAVRRAVRQELKEAGLKRAASE